MCRDPEQGGAPPEWFFNRDNFHWILATAIFAIYIYISFTLRNPSKPHYQEGAILFMGTSIDIISSSSLWSGRFFDFPQLEAMKAAFNTPESTGKWARYEFALSTSRRALSPSWHCNAGIKSAETQCLVRDACSMDLSSLAMLAVRLLSLDEFWQSFVVGTSNQCNEECRAVWYGISLFLVELMIATSSSGRAIKHFRFHFSLQQMWTDQRLFW